MSAEEDASDNGGRLVPIFLRLRGGEGRTGTE